MINSGKKFEKNFKDSIPNSTLCMRLKDGTASWSSTDKTRFQNFNPCDFIIHHKGFLFLMELKSHKGKSIPFSCIRDTQLHELIKYGANYPDAMGMIAFNFSDIEETYLVHIVDIEEFVHISKTNGTRKSFPIDWVSEVGYYVPATKKKVNYTYDVVSTLDQIISELPQ